METMKEHVQYKEADDGGEEIFPYIPEKTEAVGNHFHDVWIELEEDVRVVRLLKKEEKPL